jgi:signal transduction histidine kinase
MLLLEKCLHRAGPKALLLVLYTSAALGAPTPQDGGSERWTALADTVFQHVARDHELPNSAEATALTQDAAGFVYEAVWNAYRHAQATRISLWVGYGERELWVRISDDGRGIAPGVPQSAAAGGHFGLAGMRERARGMDARLHIESGEGRGTRVEIRLHSRLAHVG